MKQIKQLLLTGICLFCIVPALFAQDRKKPAPKPVKNIAGVSPQLQAFWLLASQANATFIFPASFKEIKAPNNEDLSFDYAIALPGKEFEIWFQVRSQKENWASYQQTLNNKNARQANPDSLYLGMGTAQAAAFTGETDFFTRTIPPSVLAKYNADVGKSYLLNLEDNAVTKHYKYALLITLQKFHTGTIMAVCLSNEKGPEFFKNIDKASNCIKFKP
ncbi:hypothetical protein FFF34_019270 [Inquilinus sp. KBS0705]|nr:hypothetical protein FFF34_019270 [Inquilinus sp. KBS0705]